MSNICGVSGRGQMTVADAHVAHHKHTCDLYRELLKDEKKRICMRILPVVLIVTLLVEDDCLGSFIEGEKGRRMHQATVQGAVGGAGGVTHAAVNAHGGLRA